MSLCSASNDSCHQSNENVVANHAAEMGDVRNAYKVHFKKSHSMRNVALWRVRMMFLVPTSSATLLVYYHFIRICHRQ